MTTQLEHTARVNKNPFARLIPKLSYLAMLPNMDSTKYIFNTLISFPVRFNVVGMAVGIKEHSLVFTLDRNDPEEAQKLMFDFLSNVFKTGHYEYRGVVYVLGEDAINNTEFTMPKPYVETRSAEEVRNQYSK